MLTPSTGPLHKPFSHVGSYFVPLQLVNTYIFSTLNDVMCIEYYENNIDIDIDIDNIDNNKVDIDPILGGSQRRLPKSLGPLV